MRAHIKPMGPAPRPIAERFAENFTKKGPDECWPWHGLVNYQNRGRFYLDPEKKMVNAPRIAMLLAGKELPYRLMACHTCDNANCVNPSHLYAGTSKENVRDMIERGGFIRKGQQGVKHHSAKHSEQTILEIRRRRNNGETGVALAKEFGVTTANICDIHKRKIWRHV